MIGILRDYIKCNSFTGEEFVTFVYVINRKSYLWRIFSFTNLPIAGYSYETLITSENVNTVKLILEGVIKVEVGC